MKILIVKLHALGDLVIVTPALRFIRENMPNAQIDLLTTDWAAPAVFGNPHLNRVLAPPHQWFFKPNIKGMFKLWAMIKDLRGERYDAAVLFHRSVRITRYIELARISRIFSFGAKTINNQVYLDESRHSVLTALELTALAVERLTGEQYPVLDLEAQRLEWFITDEEKRQTKRILMENGLKPGEFVAMFPGGGVNPNVSDLVKRWEPDNFAELADQIWERFALKTIILGGETDGAICSYIAQVSRSALNLSSRYNLRITAALTSNAKFAISNDSGPLHIAAGVGVPVIGIFGPTGPQNKLPPGPFNRAVRLGIPCSPCYFSVFKGCIYPYPKCIKDLEVSKAIDVVAEVNGMMDKYPSLEDII